MMHVGVSAAVGYNDSSHVMADIEAEKLRPVTGNLFS
jgi:hypothetical protein